MSGVKRHMKEKGRGHLENVVGGMLDLKGQLGQLNADCRQADVFIEDLSHRVGRLDTIFGCVHCIVCTIIG